MHRSLHMFKLQRTILYIFTKSRCNDNPIVYPVFQVLVIQRRDIGTPLGRDIRKKPREPLDVEGKAHLQRLARFGNERLPFGLPRIQSVHKVFSDLQK